MSQQAKQHSFQPVTGTPLRLKCFACGRDMDMAREVVWADLNGPSFRAYYCGKCKAIAVGDETAGDSLYAALKLAGIPISSHESDLYFPVTDQTRAILAAFPLQKSNATVFTNQVEGGRWYDVPFAYLPFWEARTRKREVPE